MPFDETLRQSLDALVRDMTAALEAERAAAAAGAREAAEQDTAAAVAAAVVAAQSAAHAAADERSREERRLGFEEGRKEGLKEGLEEGRKQGVEQGRREGAEQGRREGAEQARKEGLDEGRRHGFEEGRREGYAAGLADGREQGLGEGRAAAHADSTAAAGAADLATSDRLADAMRAIDRGRSLSEILDTLASCAGRETARVAVMLVRGTQLRGWRFIGFGSLDERSGYEMPLADAGIIAEAVQRATTVSADGDSSKTMPSFAQLPPGREPLAVPVPIAGDVVAVLYGDRGADAGAREVRPAWPATLEVMARHAARCLEALTAFRAAQLLTDQSHAGPPRVARAGASSAASPADDQETARRYAKLLVSEIKLYHEPEVMAGRRERDLGVRLGGEIARARVLYEQRVPSRMRGAADFFHEELVRTLAGGDESLLTRL